MKISTLLPFLILPMALTGCLQKASTKMESLISSFSLQAPKSDSANPPDFENVDAKEYVRFKGTCLSLIDSFQIQFVGNMDADGDLEYTSWFSIPTSAPTDDRTSTAQSTYPLNSSDYDTSCASDGAYDFWILMSQVNTWLGGADVAVELLNIRGMYGLLPTDILSYDTNSEDQVEANTFQFFSGYSPLGTGLCGELHVFLAHESDGVINHNVKNSATKSFTSTFDTGLDINDEITIFDSPDCSGTAMSSFSFDIPSNSTFRRFSFKMNLTVDPMRSITLATSSFGSVINKSAGFGSNTAGLADRLHAWNKVFIEDGRCENIQLLATDPNGVATNQFDYTNVNITVTLSDPTNFEFRTDCESGSSISGDNIVLTFTSGGDYKLPIYIKAKSGVTASTEATLTLSQDTSEFSNTLPTIYINPPQAVHHLEMQRLDNLAYLFNHECYPFVVELKDSSNALVTAPMGIDFKFQISGDITIHADASCSGPNLVSSLVTIPSGVSSQVYYWNRMRYSYSSTSAADGITYDYNSMSPYISNPGSSTDLYHSLTINPSLADILSRNLDEMVYWFFESMDSNAFQISSTSNSIVAESSGTLTANVPTYLATSYVSTASQGDGTSRIINRKVYDFTQNVSTAAPQATVSSNISDWTLSLDDYAAIIGAYINVTDLSSSGGKQILVHGIQNVNSQQYIMTIYPDGYLKLEDPANSQVLCSTGAGAIPLNSWTLVVLKIYRESGPLKCQLYINGLIAGSAGSVPYDLASTFGPTFGNSDLSLRFKGQLAEIFLDLDKTAEAVYRFSDANMNKIYTDYFSRRYLSSP